jgi:hypothetical protein
LWPLPGRCRPTRTGSRCRDDLDCRYDEICGEGTCVFTDAEGCLDELDCVDGQRCNSGYCVTTNDSDDGALEDGCGVAGPRAGGARGVPAVLLLLMLVALWLPLRRRSRAY